MSLNTFIKIYICLNQTQNMDLLALLTPYLTMLMNTRLAYVTLAFSSLFYEC